MRKVKIIGAGFAGLTVGCYLQMNGYETEKFLLKIWRKGECSLVSVIFNNF